MAPPTTTRKPVKALTAIEIGRLNAASHAQRRVIVLIARTQMLTGHGPSLAKCWAAYRGTDPHADRLPRPPARAHQVCLRELKPCGVRWKENEQGSIKLRRAHYAWLKPAIRKMLDDQRDAQPVS